MSVKRFTRDQSNSYLPGSVSSTMSNWQGRLKVSRRSKKTGSRPRRSRGRACPDWSRVICHQRFLKHAGFVIVPGCFAAPPMDDGKIFSRLETNGLIFQLHWHLSDLAEVAQKKRNLSSRIPGWASAGIFSVIQYERLSRGPINVLFPAAADREPILATNLGRRLRRPPCSAYDAQGTIPTRRTREISPSESASSPLIRSR